MKDFKPGDECLVVDVLVCKAKIMKLPRTYLNRGTLDMCHGLYGKTKNEAIDKAIEYLLSIKE